MPYRSSRPEVSLEKAVLRICSKFTGEHPCQSVISIKLQSSCKVIEITLRHEYCPVNSNHIFRTKFPKNTTRRLLLALVTYFGPLKISSKNCSISFAQGSNKGAGKLSEFKNLHIKSCSFFAKIKTTPKCVLSPQSILDFIRISKG